MADQGARHEYLFDLFPARASRTSSFMARKCPGGAHTGRSADWPDGKIFAKVVAPWIARWLGVGE